MLFTMLAWDILWDILLTNNAQTLVKYRWLLCERHHGKCFQSETHKKQKLLHMLY